jgi:hypothetical protein
LQELYRHTQIAWAIIIPADIAALVALYFVIAAREPAAIMALLPLLALSSLFYGLTVIGTQETIEIRFGIGAIRKRLKLKDILTAEPYRTSFWHGWGIRYCEGAVLFNVSGYDAVRLTMANGKQYIIGTDEPSKFLNFIQTANRPYN